MLRVRSLLPKGFAVATGVALSAYVYQNSRVTLQAQEPAGHIFVINGFYMAMRGTLDVVPRQASE